MAAIKSLVSVALLALLLFSESLATSAAGLGEASNSLAVTVRRNILQTAAHPIADDNGESSSGRKISVEIKRRIGRPVVTSGHRSAADRSRVSSFGVGSLLCISIVLGLLL